ncbi:MAG: general stress protein [Candidatus Tectimicrobiota bacterium]
MTKTTAALFDNRTDAYNAVQELVDHGYAHDTISILTHDDSLKEVPLNTDTTPTPVEEGLGIGAAFGGLSGLVIGLSALLVPGIGPALVVGPLAAALLGAGLGAAAGGLMGALSEMGFPEEQVRYYDEGVRRGGVLVTISTPELEVGQVESILARHHAVDLSQRSAAWRARGWTHDEPHGPVESDFQNPAVLLPASEEERFRQHFQRTYAQLPGVTYADYVPAYQYGYGLRSEQRYLHDAWDTMEAAVRADWERQHGATWEQYREAIQYAWATGQHSPAMTLL